MPIAKTLNSIEKDYDILVEAYILGDAFLSRMSLLETWMQGKYFEESWVSTRGEKYRIKNMDIGGEKIKLRVINVDSNINKHIDELSYTHAVLYAVDATDLESFDNIKEWMKKYINPNADRFLIVTNCHSGMKKKIDNATMEEFAENNDLKLIYTNAKTNFHVNEAFEEVSRTVVNRFKASPANFQLRSDIFVLKNLIAETKKKADDLMYRGFGKESADLSNLADTISTNLTALEEHQNPLSEDIKKFCCSCEDALGKAAKTDLAKHRDYRYIIANIGLAIATFGVGYLVAISINKYTTGNYLFFNTPDSEKKVQCIGKHVEKFQEVEKMLELVEEKYSKPSILGKSK